MTNQNKKTRKFGAYNRLVKKIFLYPLLICLLSTFFLSSNSAFALKSFSITDKYCTVQDEFLKLFLNITVDDEQELEKLLVDGSTIELNIKTEIKRLRFFGFDELLAEQDYKFLLAYNPLTKKFSSSMPNKQVLPSYSNLNKLLENNWRELKLNILAAENLRAKEDYQLSVNLTLQHTKLPPWLDHTLVLWSRDIVEPQNFTITYRLSD